MQSSLVIQVAEMSAVFYFFHFLYGRELVFADMKKNLGIQIASEPYSPARLLCDLPYYLDSSLILCV